MKHDDLDWNQRYATRETPWDSGKPSLELKRILKEHRIEPCRMLELGCGTGTNAVFLARHGFQVTGVDLSLLAVKKAREKARAAGVKARFLEADLLALENLGRPFAFVFDRGVYHHLRNVDLKRFLRVLDRVAKPGSFYFTLAGNANDPGPRDGGPPTVHAHEICAELGPLFDLVQLREFRFDGVVIGGKPVRPLAWSVLLRRKGRRR